MTTDLQEAGYLVWRRFAELSGDSAMVARLHIIHRARQAGCDLTVKLPDGGETRIPEMIAAEAAVAALEVGDEAEWREEWTRRLVEVAVKWQDEATTQDVAAVLNHTDTVIKNLRAAGVWPWGNDESNEK
ncbi:MAG: hypothetical protein ACYS8L_02205 [Planctomycetota bacterium]|jgi:hypothetical protein